MASAVEQIKERLNIVDVVGGYLKLEKGGANFRAGCPFHAERTPSFFVSPSRQTYHCFGCNRGGDVISFVQEIEGLDFVGALKVLAEKAGIELTAWSGPEKKTNDRWYQTLAAAAKFYQAELAKAPEVLAYLEKRGLTAATVKTFGLGWAPPGWRNLSQALEGRGFARTDLRQTGLTVDREASSYDRFRERIIFPLSDNLGRVVGFSGRIFTRAGSPAASEGAKYVNTPETALYNKSKILYGYYEAKTAIRQADAAIVVEGQMDLLLAHQAETLNVVAVSGTALTREHLNLLRRLSRNLIMAFDADAAGIGASRRAVGLCLAHGFEVRIAELPPGLDPADLISRDPAAWRRAASEAKHAIDFYLGVFSRRQLPRRELAHAIKKEIYPLIIQLAERIDRAHFVGKIAGAVGLPEAVIEADLNDLPRSAENGVLDDSGSEAPSAVEPVSRLERIERQLFGLWWWRQAAADGARLAERLRQTIDGESLSAGEKRWRPQSSELVFEAELAYQGSTPESLSAQFEELLRNWRGEKIGLELKAAAADLAAAESGGDEAAIEKNLRRFQTLSRQLNDFNNTR